MIVVHGLVRLARVVDDVAAEGDARRGQYVREREVVEHADVLRASQLRVAKAIEPQGVSQFRWNEPLSFNGCVLL